MRIVFPVALTVLTACSADSVLAPPRVAPTIHIRETSPVRPPYGVVIDGVRGDSLQLAQLNPDDIETVEVIKGPPASQLYGTHPCPEVVVIVTTKHATRTAQR